MALLDELLKKNKYYDAPAPSLLNNIIGTGNYYNAPTTTVPNAPAQNQPVSFQNVFSGMQTSTPATDQGLFSSVVGGVKKIIGSPITKLAVDTVTGIPSTAAKIFSLLNPFAVPSAQKGEAYIQVGKGLAEGLADVGSRIAQTLTQYSPANLIPAINAQKEQNIQMWKTLGDSVKFADPSDPTLLGIKEGFKLAGQMAPYIVSDAIVANAIKGAASVPALSRLVTNYAKAADTAGRAVSWVGTGQILHQPTDGSRAVQALQDLATFTLFEVGGKIGQWGLTAAYNQVDDAVKNVITKFKNGEPITLPEAQFALKKLNNAGLSIEDVSKNIPRQQYEKLSSGGKKYMDLFNTSEGQTIVGEKNGTIFSLGNWGKKHLENKTLEGKGDRFSAQELDQTIKNITDSFKGSADEANHRSLTTAWLSDMNNGEKRIIYTKPNRFGQQEITGWHILNEQKNPDFLKTLASYGAPDQSRTDILSLERSGSNPLTYGSNSPELQPANPEVLRAGIEPATQGFSDLRSTTELPKPIQDSSIVASAKQGVIPTTEGGTPLSSTGSQLQKLAKEELPQVQSQVSLDPKVGVSLSKDIPSLKANTSLNVTNLNISKEGQDLIKQVAEDIKPKIEEQIGGVLTNREVINLAERTSKTLEKVVGSEQTAQWEATLLKARQELALAGQTGTVDKSFIEKFLVVKTQGTDIARKLQSFGIGADAKEATAMETILSSVLDTNKNVDDIMKAAEGVNFNDAKQAATFYRQFIKPKASEWLDLLRYNSMLTSPKTHIINAFSNAVNSAVVAPVEKAVTGGVDFLKSTVTGSERKYFVGETGAYVKGYLSNVREAFNRFTGVLSGRLGSTNLDVRNIPLAPAGGVKGAIEKTLSVPLKLLEGMDQFFTALTQAGEKSALDFKVAKGVAVSTTDLSMKPAEAAAYRLYRSDLFPEGQGTLLNNIDSLTNLLYQARNIKGPIGTIIKFSVPFIKTPMNIFKQGLEYSPLGFTTLAGAAEKSPQVAKALIGTAVFAGGATLLASNKLSWAVPTNENEKNAFLAAGMQPYSIKIGNKWVSYQKLPPPLAFPLSMIAMIDQALKEKKLDESTGELILSSISKYGQFLADQSYAKSFGDLLTAVQGGESSIARLASNYPQQLIPFRALGGWLAKLTDDVQRKPDPQANFVEKQVQLLMMNIPGLSEKVPARTDTAGKPIVSSNNEINAFSPVTVTTEDAKKKAEYDQMLQIKKIEDQVTAEHNILKDLAQSKWNELSVLPADQAKSQLSEIAKSNPELATQIIAVGKAAKEEKLTSLETKLQSAKVDTRAQFIVQQLGTMKTPAEKKAYLKDLASKKILTDSVLKQVTALLKK